MIYIDLCHMCVTLKITFQVLVFKKISSLKCKDKYSHLHSDMVDWFL